MDWLGEYILVFNTQEHVDVDFTSNNFGNFQVLDIPISSTL